ncbi:MAG: N-acetyltransferase family protein, partial [Frankia sp.]
MLELVDLHLNHPDWSLALPVLQELRPHLTGELLEQILTEAAPQGLTFTAAMGDGTCLGIAGWRIAATTSAIRRLYVDDLVTTAAARSEGVGSRLLADLAWRAREAGCLVLDLD